MLNIKRSIALFACAASMTFFAGCEKNNNNRKIASSTSEQSNSSLSSGKIQIKNYEFPSFLKDIKTPDELSRSLYSSFDKTKFTKDVTEQPFSEFNCEEYIAEMFYTYREGQHVGLLDKKGGVVIESDKYSKIEIAADGVLILSYDKEMNTKDDYAVYSEDGVISKLDSYSFNSEKFVINEIFSESENDANAKKQYSLSVNGKIISDSTGKTAWDSIQKVDMADINTMHVYKNYYKVSRDDSYYYLCFDGFYNYTIYEGAYAYIKLKVGNSVGECYVLSSDDYKELNQMINSFGNSKNITKPTKDNSLDYIQITTGLNNVDQRVITISSDGYCLTDNITHNEIADDKYFSCLDKESFVSLVLWTEQVLSSEYTGKQPL